MFSRMTIGEKWFQVFAVMFIAGLSVLFVYPFIHVLSISLSTPSEAIRPGLHLFPQEFSLEAYRKAVSSTQIWYGFRNTIFRTVVGTVLSVVVMVMAAYPLSKKYLPDRRFYTLFIVMTMFFSGGLIPSYMLIKSLGLYDSMLVYIIPSLFVTFSLLILRNFFIGIPQELEDSARMDGANDIRILFSVVLPLSAPIIATITLWSAVRYWNEWFQALIYIQDQTKIVLQIYLRRLVVENQDMELRMLMSQQPGQETVTPETVKAAVLMIITGPIIIVYPFLQKYFVKGVMIGSLKE
ncbi:ABC transporter permease [Paenibacillus sp. MY03]|jgi:putative aldouronate transport system permease protein|uniref:ABC transporter permease n=1 Tax=Paenibacillus agaridevorans TaxID=171404 RepID=A0A2R5F0T6_9BACL|nr:MULTISPECIES: carbohydrate ABC transporter permease [Paenibacillus]OUS75088.1 ABC transporter permease [Paenibacillus sp. MY03]QNK59232.1 carbohydrate ABC transporter permease [Paenibacillus sp. PAMC21692]GBG10988.1 ABC transporter permease [Paenibacillus agaridevorans]